MEWIMFWWTQGNCGSPACQCECISSWLSRKLAWTRILYRTYKGHVFSGECSRNFVSHTVNWKQNLEMESHFNSLAPGRFSCNLKLIIFRLISMIDILNKFCEIAFRWMPQNRTNDKSTLAQVMAGCYQAISHYLSQCWPWSVSPYGVTRSQWVNMKMWITIIVR